MLVCEDVRTCDLPNDSSLAAVWKTNPVAIAKAKLKAAISLGRTQLCHDMQIQMSFLTMLLSKNAKLWDQAKDHRPDIGARPPPKIRQSVLANPSLISFVPFFTVRNSDHQGIKS